MSQRTYAQFCPMARALDVIGDRWALLVVRELLAGPRRYVDLQTALPGLSNNLLTLRLKELEAGDVVTRRQLPPPAARQVYVLTEKGGQLESVLEALALWGVGLLGMPAEGEYFSPESPLIVIRALLSRDVPPVNASSFVLSTGSVDVRISPHDDQWVAEVEREPSAVDLVVPLPIVAGIAAGESTWEAAISSGAISGGDGAQLSSVQAKQLLAAVRNRPDRT